MSASADIIETIRAQGERITLPRRLVIEALGEAHQHMTINDIQKHIEKYSQPLSDTTVYRVLQWLKHMGLVSQTDMGQIGTVYALISQPYHHHLVCLNCGATFTLDDSLFAALREDIQRIYGHIPRIEHMAIYGQCRNCVETSSNED